MERKERREKSKPQSKPQNRESSLSSGPATTTTVLGHVGCPFRGERPQQRLSAFARSTKHRRGMSWLPHEVRTSPERCSCSSGVGPPCETLGLPPRDAGSRRSPSKPTSSSLETFFRLIGHELGGPMPAQAQVLWPTVPDKPVAVSARPQQSQTRSIRELTASVARSGPRDGPSTEKRLKLFRSACIR